jgi:Ni/Fe-hydrogenase 1 B-type cytochrome subunit
MATTITFDRVYIWERPVRLYHWVTVASLLVLAATGLVIGRPPAFLTSGDASASQWFGTVRFLHFAAGYVFLFAFIVRVYWMFVGNQYARWWNFFPLTPALLRAQARRAWAVITTDLLELRVHPAEVKGHNALAAWTYALVFLVTIFQIVTGFGMYAAMSEAWLPQLFAWVVPAMGGDANVRLWHHLATWFFIVFSLIHVYLSVFHDVVEAEGEISSMVSGTKYFRRK